MEDSTLVSGRMESNMERGDTDKLMGKRDKVFGKMAKDLNGLMKHNSDLTILNRLIFFANFINNFTL
jgi:hypothetical protein